VAYEVASVGCFATDKSPFISKKSESNRRLLHVYLPSADIPSAISGYIIGVLKVQRFKIRTALKNI